MGARPPGRRRAVCAVAHIKRPRGPTWDEYRWLRRIALSPMMATHQEGEEDRYSLQNGETVPRNVAEALIMRGWVRGDKDSLFGLSQTFRVLKP